MENHSSIGVDWDGLLSGTQGSEPPYSATVLLIFVRDLMELVTSCVTLLDYPKESR